MADNYKCQYCGNNLNITDPVCPYCGRENTPAQKHIEEINEEKEKLKDVEKRTRKIIDLKTRKGQLTVILILMIAILAVNIWRVWIMDFDHRIAVEESKKYAELQINAGKYKGMVDELIKKRAYLELDAFELNASLMHSDEMDDYYSVFQCTTCYTAIYRDIMKMAEHSSYEYKYHTDEELCADIAVYIDGMKEFSSTETYYYTPERFEGEKSAYIDDIKKEAADFVIVFFGLDKNMDIYDFTQDEVTQLLLDNKANVRGENQ